uniref:NYN domain-containing protein n=1 Tax=candidate division WOR-3 bacterium TaxID=2052148 RepID=A0A7C4CAX2_UNCW3
MQPHIVVDGYNLLHKVADLAPLMGSDLELARERLESRLLGYRSGRDVRLTVVFDGSAAAAGPAAAVPGVEVVFSRAPEKADEVIVGIVAGHASPRSVTVVTSDNAVARQVRDLGAKTMSGEEFAVLLNPVSVGRHTPRPKSVPAAGAKPEMKPGDVADWESFFARGRQVRDDRWTAQEGKRARRPKRRRRG